MSTTTHQGAEGAETMTAAERVCHEEQMVIWSGEVVGRLNMGGCFRDDLTYDDLLEINAAISEEIRSIVGSAFDLSTPAPRTDGGMTAGEVLRAILLRAKWIGQKTTAEDYAARVVFDTQEEAHEAYRALVALRDATPAQPAGAVPDSLRALSEAAKDVLAERRRQVEVEGWTPEHDDEHRKGELASAAVCYASGLDLWTGHEQADRKGRPTLIGAARVWPWSGWWKPADPRRNLVKAGALILAEIERIDRASHPAGQSAGSGADTLAATLAEFQRRNGYHKREIEELLTEFGELLLSKVASAPDSTRTGQREAEELREEVAYWRRDLSARIWAMTAHYKGALERGEGVRASEIGNDLRAALASFHDAQAKDWYERCDICGEHIRDGEPTAAYEDVSGHARCLSEDGEGAVHPHGEEDLAAQVRAAQAALAEPWPEVALAARPAAPEAWTRTGSSRVPIGFGPGEWEWFRASDGVLRNYPAGFNPNSGRYEGLTITPAPPASSGQGGR